MVYANWIVKSLCRMLGCSRVSWNSKRQAFVVLSTTKAEYISTKSCCAQSIWIKHHLGNFDFFSWSYFT